MLLVLRTNRERTKCSLCDSSTDGMRWLRDVSDFTGPHIGTHRLWQGEMRKLTLWKPKMQVIWEFLGPLFGEKFFIAGFLLFALSWLKIQVWPWMNWNINIYQNSFFHGLLYRGLVETMRGGEGSSSFVFTHFLCRRFSHPTSLFDYTYFHMLFIYLHTL